MDLNYLAFKLEIYLVMIFKLIQLKLKLMNKQFILYAKDRLNLLKINIK